MSITALLTRLILLCISGQEEITRVDRIAEELGTVQNLKNAFDPILNVILLALDAPPVFMRTKALRALSQILTVDPNVLSNVSFCSFQTTFLSFSCCSRVFDTQLRVIY